MEIVSQIRKEIEQYKKSIKLEEGYLFNMYDLLRKINLYVNSKFESGQYDRQGRRKFFHNIGLFRRDTTKTILDIDPKNIRAVCAERSADLQSAVLSKEIKDYLRKNGYGKILNDMAEELATFGSVCIRTIKGRKPEIEDLRRLYFDQSDFNKSPSHIKEHLMTIKEVLDMKGWKNVKEVVDEHKKKLVKDTNEDPYIHVFERYGYVEEDGEYVQKVYFVTGLNGEYKSVNEDGVTLFEGDYKELPWDFFSIRTIKGRALGVGDFELLIDAQIRANELANQKARAMEISSLHLFQTQDSNLGSNVLTDYDNGDFIVSPNQVTPIVNEERNLAAFTEEQNWWNDLADKLTFSFPMVRGEQVAATMTATLGVLQDTNAKSVLKIMRQNFAEFVRDLFQNKILKEIKKEVNAEHIFRFAGDVDEINAITAEIIEKEVENRTNDYIENTGFWPSEEYLAQIRQEVEGSLKKKSRLYMNVPDGLFDDDYEIEILVDDQYTDMAANTQNYQGLLAMLGANPMLYQDPVMKKIFYKLAESLGISPMELELAQADQSKVMQNQNATITGAEGMPQANIPVQGLATGAGVGQALPQRA